MLQLYRYKHVDVDQNFHRLVIGKDKIFVVDHLKSRPFLWVLIYGKQSLSWSDGMWIPHLYIKGCYHRQELAMSKKAG